MPNNHVFNSFHNPVFTHSTNTYTDPGIVSPPENGASRAGSLFSITGSASALVVLSLISAVITLKVTNPGGSGKTVYVSRIGISIGGSSLLSALSGSASFQKGGTLSSPTTLTPTNNNFNSSAVSVMTAQSSTAAPTGGTTFNAVQLAPGGLTQEYTGSIIVPPGNSITVSVTSSSSSVGLTITSSANISWWEA
ncbi:hypothetical protein [Paenibacillus sp. UNC451MF]|uniref:hypothetical protein n=1 Tax=Paenibacillus sp. UNC451MF TaxID=1449063 RepID=UPI00048E666D|nr:hypothetical protein [Paenibacillus sp. UNC451MF]